MRFSGICSMLAFVYLDDILVFSKSPQEHVVHVRQVLQRLLKNNLFVKAEKCEFHTTTVSCLDFVIYAGDIRMDSAKTRAVADWPVPVIRRELQCFLGFCQLLPAVHS